MSGLQRAGAVLGICLPLVLLGVGCEDSSSTSAPATVQNNDPAPQPAGPTDAQPGAGGASTSEQQPGTTAFRPGELLKFLPPQLTSAIGANLTTMDQKTALNKELFGQLAPWGKVLARGGLKWEQVSEVWAGSVRSSRDTIGCFRMKSKLDLVAVRTGLGAAETPEKVGKALVYKLADHPTHANTLAIVDATTLIIGRQALVAEALNNPPPGPIRQGYEALGSSSAYFWLGGDALFAERQLTQSSVDVFTDFFTPVKGNLLKPAGFVIGFAAPGTGGSAGGGQAGAVPGAPGAMPPGPGADPAGAGPIPPGPDAGAPGNPSLSSGGNPHSGVSLIVGWTFLTENQASATETVIQSALRRAQQAAEAHKRFVAMLQNATNNPGAGAAPPGQPPGPGGAPANPPAAGANVGGNGGDDQSDISIAPSGIVLIGEMSQQQQLRVARKESTVTLTLNFGRIDPDAISGLMGEVLLSMGVPAINDGIFDGSLPTLGKAFNDWTAGKPGPQVGVRKVKDLPLRAGYSWMTELLPHLGRDDIYLQFNFEKSWAERENIQHAYAVVPAFLNPADTRGQWKGYPFDGMGLTHFVGMSGVEDGRNSVAAALDRSDPNAGIFGYDAILPLDQVRDGTSQTILMIGTGRISAPWVQGGGATIRGARAPYFDSLTGFSAEGIPGGGTYVLFADGSARVIPANIDPAVFRAMCTAHGADEVDFKKLVTSAP